MLQTDRFQDMAGPLTLIDQVSVLNPDVPIDGLNWRVEAGGGIRGRPGTAIFSDFDSADAYNSIAFSQAGAADHFLAAADDVMWAIATDGSDTTSVATGDSGPFGFARFGAPTVERTFFCQGTDVRYWDGTAFGTVAGTPSTCRALAVTPWDNRLMCAGFSTSNGGPAAAASSTSHVYFSEQADPATWVSTYREILTPGDGEDIVAAVTWRDRVFVFKQTRIFVFYGTANIGGAPKFEYYVLDARAGTGNVRGACAGRDGVYFVSRNGVYRTDGGEPELLSQGLDPMFLGKDAPYFTGTLGSQAEMANASVSYAAEQIHVGVPTTGGGRVSLVFDPRTNWWGYDDIPIVAGCTGVLSGIEQLVYCHPTSLRIWRHAETLSDDEGTTIPGHWRSGWHDFGVPDVKRLRHARVFGNGQVSLGYAVDFENAVLSAGTLELDVTADTWGDGLGADDWAEGDSSDTWSVGRPYGDDWARNVQVRGRHWSWKLTRVGDTDWSVQLVEHHRHHRARRPAADVSTT